MTKADVAREQVDCWDLVASSSRSSFINTISEDRKKMISNPLVQKIEATFSIQSRPPFDQYTVTLFYTDYSGRLTDRSSKPIDYEVTVDVEVGYVYEDYQTHDPKIACKNAKANILKTKAKKQDSN